VFEGPDMVHPGRPTIGGSVEGASQLFISLTVIVCEKGLLLCRSEVGPVHPVMGFRSS
jgi:hypothetical protein